MSLYEVISKGSKSASRSTVEVAAARDDDSLFEVDCGDESLSVVCVYGIVRDGKVMSLNVLVLTETPV